MEKYICKTCNKEKEAKYFSLHSGCKSGYDISRCKSCKKSAYDWKQIPLEKRIFNRLKGRAKSKGIEFNLELKDIILPEFCPVFKKPFIYGDSDWTYSVDRNDNSKGYVKGNIVIMSNRANRIKGDFTIEELEQILLYLNNQLNF